MHWIRKIYSCEWCPVPHSYEVEMSTWTVVSEGPATIYSICLTKLSSCVAVLAINVTYVCDYSCKRVLNTMIKILFENSLQWINGELPVKTQQFSF